MQHPTPNGGKIVLAEGHGVELMNQRGNVADYVFDHAFTPFWEPAGVSEQDLYRR